MSIVARDANFDVGGDAMVNVNKLKAKFVENGINVETMAGKMGIDGATLYRRLSNNGENFTIGEADLIARILELSKDEVNAIFFAQYVA